jgi:hypothetical protein
MLIYGRDNYLPLGQSTNAHRTSVDALAFSQKPKVLNHPSSPNH